MCNDLACCWPPAVLMCQPPCYPDPELTSIWPSTRKNISEPFSPAANNIVPAFIYTAIHDDTWPSKQRTARVPAILQHWLAGRPAWRPPSYTCVPLSNRPIRHMAIPRHWNLWFIEMCVRRPTYLPATTTLDYDADLERFKQRQQQRHCIVVQRFEKANTVQRVFHQEIPHFALQPRCKHVQDGRLVECGLLLVVVLKVLLYLESQSGRDAPLVHVRLDLLHTPVESDNNNKQPVVCKSIHIITPKTPLAALHSRHHSHAVVQVRLRELRNRDDYVTVGEAARLVVTRFAKQRWSVRIVSMLAVSFAASHVWDTHKPSSQPWQNSFPHWTQGLHLRIRR